MQNNEEKICTEVAESNLDEAQTEEQISLKKFKTAKALEEAYYNLEKEFTKKCQQYKELLGEGQKPLPAVEIQSDEGQKLLDSFTEKYPIALSFKDEILARVAGEPLRESCLEGALANVLAENFVAPCDIINNPDFVDNYVFSNESIKEKIIDDYLSGMANAKTPVTITGGGKALLTPPSRPKSLKDAGEIMQAMLINKRSI